MYNDREDKIPIDAKYHYGTISVEELKSYTEHINYNKLVEKAIEDNNLELVKYILDEKKCNLFPLIKSLNKLERKWRKRTHIDDGFNESYNYANSIIDSISLS